MVVSVIFPDDNSMQDGCPHCDCSVSATSLVCSQEDGTACLERRLSLCFGLLASHFSFPFLGHIFLVLSSGLLLHSVKLQFHQFGGSSPQVTSQQKCIPRFSLTWMNKFPERIRQLFFLLLPDFSREVYFQASGQGAIESLHRFG